MKQGGKIENDPMIGRRVGVYRLRRKLGAGKTGTVYLAERDDGEFRQTVAVKIGRAASDLTEGFDNFRRERQMLASLDHPNISYFVGGGSTEDGLPFYVLEYVVGIPLFEFCAKFQPDMTSRLKIIRSVCDAVEAAHRQKIVHFNIHPSNILIKTDGTPKLLDFETAPICDQASSTGRFPSSFDPRYASPEKLTGEMPQPESDIFSIGVILDELIKGLSSERAPEALNQIVKKATEKDPVNRFSSARQMAVEIDNFLTGEKFPKTSAGSRKRSVAILPFKMYSSESAESPDEHFLGIGLADALVSRLSGVPRMIVRPTSSVLSLVDSNPVDAGRRLDVEHVLDGSIRRAGTRLRVSVQLLDVRRNAAVWAENFDEDLSDVLELEDVIAEKASKIILPHLTGKERQRIEKRGTNVNAAYQTYLRGRYFANRFSGEAIARSVEAYELAIKLDPEYALPYVGLADSHVWSVIFGEVPSREGFPKAKTAIEKALAIDDSLGEAYAILGFITLLYDWNWDEAERLIRIALELTPNYYFAHEALSAVYASRGGFEKACEEIVMAEQLDPMSPRAKLMTCWTFYQARRFHDALDKAREANDMQNNFAQGLLHLGNTLIETGRADEAVDAVKTSLPLWQNPGMPSYILCFALAGSNRLGEARAIIHSMIDRSKSLFMMPYFLAMAHTAVGDSESAFHWFEKAVEEKNVWLIWFAADPKIDKLRSDNRYRRILEKIGHPAINGYAENSPSHDSSIAVLPFRFLRNAETGDRDDDYLSVGLADSLTTRLSNLRRLLVRPTSSVLSFSGSNLDSFETGRKLGVDFVLEGNLRRFADRIRITAQLLDIRENSTRWAERFDEATADVLTLEDSISERVTKCLLPRLTGDEEKRLSKRGTNSPQAYEAYMRARYFWNQFTPESFPKVIHALETAVAFDPNFAQAYAAIADFYNWSTIYGIYPADRTAQVILENAEKALSIDSSLGEAYAALGLYYSAKCDHKQAESNYRRAIELYPNYSLAHEWLAATLVGTGRFDEGICEIRTAEQLDPFSLRAKTLTSWTQYQARRFENALEKAREIISLDPAYPQGYLQLANAQLELGFHSEALENSRKALQLMSPSTLPVYLYCFALAAVGETSAARDTAEALVRRSEKEYVSPYFIGMAWASLLEADRAIAYFDSAYRENNQWLLWFGTEPKLDPLRQDPRFTDLLDKIDLSTFARR